MALDRDRWRLAEKLFLAALAEPPERREEFLAQACGSDTLLRQTVGRLMEGDQRAAGFLEEPASLEPVFALTRGSLVGRQLGSYHIVSFIDAGGMGEVYRAHDAKLDRDVAVKTLPPEFARDASRLARFHREARTLAALNHPNIAAIYGVEQSDGVDYLVLELVDGSQLRGPLSVPAAIDCACQMAHALQAAHEHGVIHRDLKPANIKVTPDGRVKILDFGVAKALTRAADPPETSPASTPGTLTGLIVGTPGYMSPEQVRGGEVDHRTDIWAFGCLCYELLAGTRAFAAASDGETLAHALDHEPDWQALPADTPPEVRNLVRRCLDKDATQRPVSMASVRAELEAAQRPPARWRAVLARLRQPRYAALAAACLLLAAFAGLRLYQHSAKVRWVREEVLPELTRLVDGGDYKAAFRLLRRADTAVPGDEGVKQLRARTALPLTVRTNPAGAEVWATGYEPGDEDWVRLGTTPFTTRLLPLGFYRVRVQKPQFDTIIASGEVRGGTTMEFDLDPAGSLPAGMVRVPAGTASVPTLDDVKVGRFVIDRDEVTNRQFKVFVDSGGYGERRYWTAPFVRDGRVLAWEEAMPAFIDATGQPGPSTWSGGTYAPGRGDDPAAGISWFEAAAFAEFAGKRLPTIYHWQRAASPGWFGEVVELSNFRGAGPAPVGSYRGLGAFGTLDMAGNVKEWCWNEVAGARCARGGAWNQAMWTFAQLDARSPWDRSPENGFRCMRADARGETALDAPVSRVPTDRVEQTPVSDEVFQFFRDLYAYDPAGLDARTEGVALDTPDWRRETVSFASVVPNERIVAYLYTPTRAKPPYQAVLYANPGMALRLPSPEHGEERIFEFVVKSGRALLHPALKGYYHRRYTAPPAGPNEARDRLVVESKEFRRCIDYLAARADVGRDRLGVFGLSRGASLLSILAVGETRLRAAVLFSVGLTPNRLEHRESDPFHFLPRFTVPTLMAAGRYDFGFPIEGSQRPMLFLLGAAEKDKRLIQWAGGHGDLSPHYPALTREALAWFDRYLGPVK
ncbi:MAG: protein kinase [Vicinamibacterales bacterium]|nr:protein kinase [Vicinamibacterales bacterium]